MNPKKLIIGFYAAGLPFHGDSLSEKSLGGSETAALMMAKELAKRGHDVKVFNNCPKPGRYDGVDYFDAATSWRDIIPIVEWDVFIVSRHYSMLGQRINARMIGLWNHDILVDSKSLMSNTWNIDWMWCLSDFHVDQYVTAQNQLRGILHKTRNGIDLEYIDSVRKTVERQPDIFVYGSRPERGLDILLTKTWPKILKEVNKDAKLVLAGYSDEGLSLPDDVKKLHDVLNQMIVETPNVETIGSLTKENWYKLLASAKAVLYPTNFPEISCINALEAQACGTPIITTAAFALTETVGDKNNLISGHPTSDQYQNQFVSRVKRLVTNENEFKISQKKGRNHVEGTYEWKIIAEEWEEFFWDKFENRSLTNGGRNVIRNMIYKSDLICAKWCLDNPTESGLDPKSCSELKNDIERYLNIHHEDPEFYERPDHDSSRWEENVRFQKSLKHIERKFGKTPFTLLDVGCGDGSFLASALKAFPNQVSVSGIDFSDGLLKRAGVLITKHFPDVGDPQEFLTCGDVLTLDPPKKDEDKADCIFAGEWLEHQADYIGALQTLQKWVKPGGLVVVTIPSGPWEAMSYKEFGDTRCHVHHFEFRDVEEIFLKKIFEMEYFPMGVSNIDLSLLGNWIISFQCDDKPFGKINYVRKFKTMRPYQFISACMIVKNEEDNLSRCLKSIDAVVDEIIVVDTGSTDSTVEIAKRFTDKVYQIEWPNDFSIARNTSISYAHPQSDWIYWMDADEILINAAKLRKYINTPLYSGYIITQNHLVLDMPNVKPDVPVRLYRNNSGIKFYGAIHEHCEFAMDKPIDPVLILPDVKIIHYGYLTESVRRSKCKDRNLELLRIDREKYPERKLGVVLMMRDYLNISQWELEESEGVFTEKIVKLLREVIRLHQLYFSDESNIYHELSYSLYQRALESLGRQGIPGIGGQIPFQVVLAFGGAVGGMSDPGNVNPNIFWFADRQEFSEFITSRADLMCDSLSLEESKGKTKRGR